MNPSQAQRPPSGDELRRATFPQAFKGYDREAVHQLLDRVASWLDARAGEAQHGKPDVRRELERVGQRTAGILTAAEEAAAKLREEATDYARTIREAADEESQRMRLDASRRVEQLITEAETKAERIIDEALARRGRLNKAIESLVERRDVIADEAQRLGEELLIAVERIRESDAAGEDTEPTPSEPSQGEPEAVAAEDEATEPDAEQPEATEPTPSAPSEPPPDERETAIHRTA